MIRKIIIIISNWEERNEENSLDFCQLNSIDKVDVQTRQQLANKAAITFYLPVLLLYMFIINLNRFLNFQEVHVILACTSAITNKNKENTDLLKL